MSLLPYLIDDFYPVTHNIFDSGYYPETTLYVAPLRRSLLNTLANTGNYLRNQLSNDGLEKQSHIGKDGFQVCPDVQHFQPNEISVKTENNSIVVHAKHEEKKDDHGFISREFTRRYELPKGFKVEDVTSSLSSDGILCLKCPQAPAIEGGKVRQVQIQQTGQAKLNVKSNEEQPAQLKNSK